MNKLEQKIYDLSRQLKCLAKEVCTLSEGGGVETDPIFTASPSFNILSGDISNWNEAVSLMHEHSNISTLAGITPSKVTNWDAAFSATQSLSANYFPLPGGTLTGTGGSGFVGFRNQNATPSNPADGFKLFANAGNNPTFQKLNGVLTELVFSTTANRSYTFNDVSGTVVLSEGDLSINGNKTFNGTTTLATTTLSGNITPSSNNSRLAGSTTFNFLDVFTSRVRSSAFFTMGTTSSSSSISVQQGGTQFPAGWFANTGDVFFQGLAAIPTTNNAGAQFLHSKTAASGVARGVYITNALTAAANNDVLVSLDISPTFTNGAFTGVTNYAIRTVNSGILIGGNISFDADLTRSIGSASVKAQYVYAGSYLKGTTASGLNFAVTNPGTDTFARFHVTSHNLILQAAGAAGTDTGERLQVIGSSWLNGLVTFGSGYKWKTDTTAAATLSLTTAMTVVTGTGTTSTWTLPALTGNSGIFYILINRGSGTITLNTNAGGNDIISNGVAVNTISILANEIYRLVHNGTNFIVL